VAQHIINGSDWKNHTIILLKADAKVLKEFSCQEGWTAFFEPDQENMLTAVAGLNKMEECKELKLL
jgi:hypothetical protein